MSTNEIDTMMACGNGVENDAVPPENRAIFERAHQDEQRHKAWMDEAAKAA